MYDKLVTKFNAIDTSKFVLKTQYKNDKSGFEKNDAIKKIPDAIEFKKQNIILRWLRVKVKYVVLLA